MLMKGEKLKRKAANWSPAGKAIKNVCTRVWLSQCSGDKRQTLVFTLFSWTEHPQI